MASKPLDGMIRLRGLIIRRPEFDYEQIAEEWGRRFADHPVPDERKFRWAVASVVRRYGFQSITDVPHLPGSPHEVDEEALARLLWNLRPEAFPSQINELLASDGINIPHERLVELRGEVRKQAKPQTSPVPGVAKKRDSPMDSLTLLRLVLLEHPNVKTEVIQRELKRRGLTGSLPSSQAVASARYGLRQKYGVTDLAEILFHDGNRSVSHAARHLYRRLPHQSPERLMELLAADGLKGDITAIRQIKRELDAGAMHKEESSPDPNQDTGPRARIQRFGRPPVRAAMPESHSGKSGMSYAEMENRLDEMVLAALSLEDGDDELLTLLRSARRRATIRAAQTE